MMRILYDIIFIFFSLLYLPYMVFKGKLHGELARRFALSSDLKFQAKSMAMSMGRPIWIHAVSVGEVRIAALLVEALGKRSKKDIVVSTVTPTGNNLARRILEKDITVIYAPLDLSFIVNKFVRSINPAIFLMMETELWPNLIYALHKKNIPIALINGRISPASFKGYSKIKFITSKILPKISLLCMQTEEDKKRIISLGAVVDKIKVTGSMKFDNKDDVISDKEEYDYRLKLGICENDRLLIAGSTHPGEEEIILNIYKRLCFKFPNLKLLIAPRHPQRAPAIIKMAIRFDLEAMRFSFLNKHIRPLRQRCREGLSPWINIDKDKKVVFVIDTIGHLNKLYKLASVVFIGGSLVERGGQNILEPASFAKPIIFGPHMFNFSRIASLYLSHQAAIRVEAEEDLEAAIVRILTHPEDARKIGQRAKELIAQNKGAVERNLNLITQLVKLH
ncbi:MAG TPA: 3-deoxy-D-manno-octulosonic acid transferase [Candidatus Omnitrophica bacterium]|nr:3-deoxy-D-manno-octulosonic acid transferase [Candidatus Omnitrophota bacterium]